MHVDFETVSGQTQRLPNPLLPVHHEFTRQHMKNPSFMGDDRQGPRALDRTLDVFPRDLCLLERFHGTLDIDHDAFAEPSRRAGSDPDDVKRPLIGDFRNYGADLRGPDIQPHKNLITLRHSPHTLSRTMTRLS